MNQYFIKKMTGFVLCLLVFACVSLVFSVICIAQETSEDEFTKFVPLRGRVVDEEGNGISGVLVSVYCSYTGACTKDDGIFEISVPKDQQFGLVFSHVKYITRTFPIDSSKISDELTVVMKESVCEIDLINRIFHCPPDQIDRNLPIPIIRKKDKEEELFQYHRCEMPEFPGGIANFYKLCEDEIRNQQTLNEKGRALRGVYHGSLLIDKSGWMEVLKIKEQVTTDQEKKIRGFFSRLGQWKPALQMGKVVELKYRFTIAF